MSFIKFSDVTTVSDNYEFPTIKEEFTNTTDITYDETLYCLYTALNKDAQNFKQAIKSKEIHENTKCKSDSLGKIKFKARLVIRSFKDSNSYDLKDTYAPVSNN